MGALEPSAGLSPGDVLDQIVRLDVQERETRGEQREDRMVKLTQDIRDLTDQIRLLSIAAVCGSVAAIVVALLN